jgi:succinate dehydrogenase / fumarate reductase membrane anchor subunit
MSLNLPYHLHRLGSLMLPLMRLFKSIFLKRINEGTAHWVSQRAVSVVLIPLTAIFLFSFVKHIGLEYDQIVVIYKSPFRALLTLLFFFLTLLHFKQGAQVVIEDYIQDNKLNTVLLLINSIAFWVISLCIFLALARILF